MPDFPREPAPHEYSCAAQNASPLETQTVSSPLEELQAQIVTCRRCPRLVAWREDVAKAPPKRYQGQEYWARPVPSFGDYEASLMIVGLAPGAHGSNRTGRMFTGDNSGVFLFAALHRTNWANQAHSTHRHDGLELNDALITAALHCAPPDNKPRPDELLHCRPYLLDELRLMPNLRVLLGLGKIGFDAAFDAAREVGITQQKTRPRFGHGAQFQLNESLWLLGTYHPSQQNTFTGRLTEPMLDSVLLQARQLVEMSAA